MIITTISISYILLAILGGFVGVVSGFFGIGGGMVLVPLLMSAGLGIKQAIAISIMQMVFSSIFGTILNISKQKKLINDGLYIGLGGFVGGILMDFISLSVITYGIITICMAWAVMIFTLDNPAKTKIAYIHIDDTDYAKHKDLHKVKGCQEWYINESEHIVVVKYDERLISEEQLKEILSA